MNLDRDNEDEERHYWESIEDEKREEEEREAQKRADAIETMEAWFFEQFEDPQVEMPRDSEEQTFLFPWGGPFEASDVLHGEFSHRFDEATIMAAVEHIERDGTVEWAPTSHGDYYEHPDPEPEPEADEVSVANRAELTERILDRLDQLEAAIASLPGQPGNIGHNAPPEEIGLPPYGEAETAEIRLAIVETRTELAAADPDPAELATLSRRFAGWGKALGTWLTKKGDLAVDEFIKNAMKVATWGGALTLFHALADDLIALAKQLLGGF
ncbi:hypothetical protein [Stakelama pacifica]|uniref:Uncharacterized protein n=1 Tax=Stakelama pacifica TaxID=517720 RepID=A0A4R6FPF2_9SPHN|nr:hypothetical protein [Stakelama pacifica]TDN83536.1 hypothetical protein EV664_10419 [Stakelama pacifica]GGO94104.1 hypothetical protein GCM10011329_15090 [Stakelama pacifica]